MHWDMPTAVPVVPAVAAVHTPTIYQYVLPKYVTWWIYVISCVRPAGLTSGTNLTVDVMCKLFKRFISYLPCL